MYLPKVMVSPKMNADIMRVMTMISGVVMAKNTGPFFSITHACM